MKIVGLVHKSMLCELVIKLSEIEEEKQKFEQRLNYCEKALGDLKTKMRILADENNNNNSFDMYGMTFAEIMGNNPAPHRRVISDNLKSRRSIRPSVASAKYNRNESENHQFRISFDKLPEDRGTQMPGIRRDESCSKCNII